MVVLFTFLLLVLYLRSHGDAMTAMMWKKIDNSICLQGLVIAVRH